MTRARRTLGHRANRATGRLFLYWSSPENPGGQPPVALTTEYSDDPSHARQWNAFTARIATASIPTLATALAAANVQPFEQRWKAEHQWQWVK